MKEIKILLTTIGCTFFVWTAQTQSIFKAGVSAGRLFSQVDGDAQQGFDRPSWTVGLRGAVVLKKNMDISVELQYNEKGADVPRQDRLKGQYIEIDLQYAEVPILFNYHFEERKNGSFRWTFLLGGSYGRLLKADYFAIERYQPDLINTVYMQPERFNTHEFSLISGFAYNPMPRLALHFRGSVAVNRFYEIPPEAVNITTINRRRIIYSGFQNYFVSATLSYDFIAPKLVKKRQKKTNAKSPKSIF